MRATVGTPEFSSRAEFARRHDVSKAAVTQWAAAGRIKIAEDGRVDVKASDRMLADSAGASRGGKRRRGALGGVQDSPSGSLPLPLVGGTLLEARTAVASIA